MITNDGKWQDNWWLLVIFSGDYQERIIMINGNNGNERIKIIGRIIWWLLMIGNH